MSRLVSVIIPTYNRKDILARAVNSVQDQTYKNLEIIIVDDCSNDGTEDVVKELQESDSRIKYIRNENNLDAQESRNKGIRLAEGEFIASLDDDDLWLNKKIELQMQFIDEYSIIGCLHSFDKKPFLRKYFEKNNEMVFGKSLEEFFYSNKGFSPSKILTRKKYLLEVGGYDKNLPGPEGLDIFIKIVTKFGPAAYINRILTVHFTNHEYGRITTSKRMLLGSIKEYKKNLNFRSESANNYRKCQVYLLLFLYKKKTKFLLKAVSIIEIRKLGKYLKLFRIRLFENTYVGNKLLYFYRMIKYV